jgi:hypothetical protein
VLIDATDGAKSLADEGEDESEGITIEGGDDDAVANRASAPDVFALLDALKLSGGSLDATEEDGDESGAGASASEGGETSASRAHKKQTATYLRKRVGGLLTALLARVSDSGTLWGCDARFRVMHGDAAGAIVSLQAQCRLLKSRPQWKKLPRAFIQMVRATVQLCEAYMAEVRRLVTSSRLSLSAHGKLTFLHLLFSLSLGHEDEYACRQDVRAWRRCAHPGALEADSALRWRRRRWWC